MHYLLVTGSAHWVCQAQFKDYVVHRSQSWQPLVTWVSFLAATLTYCPLCLWSLNLYLPSGAASLTPAPLQRPAQPRTLSHSFQLFYCLIHFKQLYRGVTDI